MSSAGSHYEEVLQLHPRITQEMNADLTEEFSDDEIKRALDDIGDLKAPGPDGMPSLFYKQFWNVVGNDVIREVRMFLQGGERSAGWNETTVVLIPKVPQPERIKDLRPISLCNVI